MRRARTVLVLGVGAVLVLLSLPASAQVGGTSLGIPPDVRAEGMGRSFVTLDRSAYAAWGNPGALGLVEGLDAAAMTTRLVPDLAVDVHLDYQAVVFGFGWWTGNVPFNLNLGVNHTHLSYGEVFYPPPLGSYEPQESTTGATMALGVADLIGAGVGFKMFNPDLGPFAPIDEDTYTGVDVGFYARTPAITIPDDGSARSWSRLRFLGAVAWSNVDGGSGGDLPQVRREALGAEFQLIPASRLFPTSNRWLARLLDEAHLFTVSAAFGREKDLDYQAIPDSVLQSLPRNDREGIVTSRGFEVRFLDVLSLRSGYLFDDPGEIKDSTFGWGISWLGYAGIDYARIPQYRELSKVAKWSFWFRVPFDVSLN